MTALSFLETAKALDLDVRFIDTLIERAVNDPDVHPKVISRLLKRRAENVHRWAAHWATKPVWMVK